MSKPATHLNQVTVDARLLIRELARHHASAVTPATPAQAESLCRIAQTVIAKTGDAR